MNSKSISLKVSSDIQITEISKILVDLFQNEGYLTEFTQRVDDLKYKIIFDDIEQDKNMFMILAFIVYIVSIFALMMSINRLIKQQKREIGIELSLGNSARSILSHYLSFGLIIGILSIPIAILLGIQLGNLFSQTGENMFNTTEWNREILWELGLEASIIGVAFASIASFYPAYKASKMLPIKAMRQDPSLNTEKNRFGNKKQKKKPHNNKRSKIGNVIDKIASRNILRTKQRSLATIFGFGLSIALIFSIMGIFTSIENVNEMQVDQMGDWDLKVSFSGPIPEELTKNITSIEEVTD